MVIDVLQPEDGRAFGATGYVVVDPDGNVKKEGTLSGSQ
jgi:hypothetical protein